MKGKSIDFKTIPAKLAVLAQKLRQYAVLVFVVALVAMYGYLVFRINTLTGQEPSEDAIAQKLQAVKRPKIDQSAIDKIQQLQDNSVEVQSLFQQARDNPFQE